MAPLVLHANSSGIRLEQLTAAFIFKFTNYIEWPASENKNFKIAVFNDEKLSQELEEIFIEKTVKKRHVIIKLIDKFDNVGTFDILFIEEITPELANEINKWRSAGLLIITQSMKGLNYQSHINFYTDDEKKLRFEINNESANSKGIKINSRLLNLSRSMK